MTTANPKAKLHDRLKKSPDFELHIRTVKVDGVEAIELRDFIPSEKWYGRGVNFAPSALPDVIEALKRLQKHYGSNTKAALRESLAAEVPGLL